MSRLDALMISKNVAFGTSGARGLVEEFTTQVCAALTFSFLNMLKARSFSFNQVVLACDFRLSSENIMLSCASSIRILGLEPVFMGVIPTPALAYYAMKAGAPCIVITGSHIPFDRNGLKLK